MKFYLLIVLCCFSFAANASKKAITDEGDVVILNNDGTWHFEDSQITSIEKLTLNTGNFNKTNESSFLLKSKKNQSKFWIQPKKWSFTKAIGTDSAIEYNFSLKSGDVYGMAITEEIEIPLDDLAQIAFQNAQAAAPDARVLEKEYRVVNGHKVIYMRIGATMQGIKFNYLGYYFSNEAGSTQLVTYTGEKQVGKYSSDIDNFLNGYLAQ